MPIDLNLIFWIVFIAVIIIFLLDQISEYLNIKALVPKVPEEFSNVFDDEKYSQSLKYTKVTTKFGFADSTFNLVAFLLFWLFGGFGWLDGIVSSFNYGPVASGLIFFGILIFSSSILGLPFELYETFKIEAEFGFNNTTLKTFISDKIKGVLLGAIIGLPVLSLILWLFENIDLAWLWGWIFISSFSLLMAYLAPAVILPMFNKFEPLEDGELKTAINEMSEKCNFPLTELSVMDGSKRSKKSNAFFTGFGKK